MDPGNEHRPRPAATAVAVGASGGEHPFDVPAASGQCRSPHAAGPTVPKTVVYSGDAVASFTVTIQMSRRTVRLCNMHPYLVYTLMVLAEGLVGVLVFMVVILVAQH